MDLAIQKTSTDKTVRSDTIEVLKEFNLQSLTTQAKKGEHIVSMMPAIRRTFTLIGDDIVGLRKENERLKNKIAFDDEKWP